MNLTKLVASCDVENNPGFTEFYVQACKSFLALAYGCHLKMDP